jgi:hypothetical protein
MKVTNIMITGGIYPGKYRSTSVCVPTENREKAFESATEWAKKNFPDWNHMDRISIEAAALHQIPVSRKVPTFISKRR